MHSVRIRLAQKEDKELWNSFVDQSTNGRIFHRFEWSNLIKFSKNREPLYFMFEKGGSILALIPATINSFLGIRSITIPSFGRYGDPICKTTNNGVYVELLEGLKDACKEMGVSSITIRSEKSYLDEITYLGKDNQRTCCFILNVPKDVSNLLTYEKRTRWSLRKAMKENLAFTEENNLQGIRKFYSLYLETARRWGFDPKPLRFFEVLREVLKSELHCFLIESEEPLAALLAFGYKNSVTIYLNASSEEARRIQANVLLYHRTIEWASKREFDFVDFGPTPNNPQDSLFLFKRGWGAKPVEIFEYRYSFSESKRRLEHFFRTIYFFSKSLSRHFKTSLLFQ